MIAGETGGIAMNWGNYPGAKAFSPSGATVVATDTLGETRGGRFSLSGSIGISAGYTDRIFRQENNARVATRVGAQFTW